MFCFPLCFPSVDHSLSLSVLPRVVKKGERKLGSIWQKRDVGGSCCFSGAILVRLANRRRLTRAFSRSLRRVFAECAGTVCLDLVIRPNKRRERPTPGETASRDASNCGKRRSRSAMRNKQNAPAKQFVIALNTARGSRCSRRPRRDNDGALPHQKRASYPFIYENKHAASARSGALMFSDDSTSGRCALCGRCQRQRPAERRRNICPIGCPVGGRAPSLWGRLSYRNIASALGDAARPIGEPFDCKSSSAISIDILILLFISIFEKCARLEDNDISFLPFFLSLTSRVDGAEDAWLDGEHVDWAHIES